MKTMEQIEELARQACWDGIIEVECPICSAIITAEPDVIDLYCEECEKVTMKNPLTHLGFI